MLSCMNILSFPSYSFKFHIPYIINAEKLIEVKFYILLKINIYFLYLNNSNL